MEPILWIIVVQFVTSQDKRTTFVIVISGINSSYSLGLVLTLRNSTKRIRSPASHMISYTLVTLLDVRRVATGSPSTAQRRHLDRLFNRTGLWRARGRGRRAGWALQRPIQIVKPRIQQLSRRLCRPTVESVSATVLHALVYPRIQCHSDPSEPSLRFALQNLRSVNSKLENVINLLEDHCLNLLILTESWHKDSNSTAIKRLRGHRLNVIEAARPIPAGAHREDPGFVNH